CHPTATRAYIASSAALAGSPSDEVWQREALFDSSQSDDAVRLGEMPRTAGRAGAPAAPAVRIVYDAPNAVTVEAALPQPSVLVPGDTYDSAWIATADGLPATIARANGLYRAVALPAGRHIVQFTYRPRDLFVGLTFTVAGLLLSGFAGFAGFSGFGVL